MNTNTVKSQEDFKRNKTDKPTLDELIEFYESLKELQYNDQEEWDNNGTLETTDMASNMLSAEIMFSLFSEEYSDNEFQIKKCLGLLSEIIRLLENDISAREKSDAMPVYEGEYDAEQEDYKVERWIGFSDLYNSSDLTILEARDLFEGCEFYSDCGSIQGVWCGEIKKEFVL